jgi:ribosomal protein S18 acetylase RimI-like enzyme
MINIIEFSGKESKFQYKKISLIHKKSISDGFLSSLNLSILIKLYRGFAKSKYAKLFVALDNENNILGFIVVSFATSKLYKEIIFQNFLLIIPLLLPKMLRISFLLKIFETLLYPFKDKIVIGAESELLNFCVEYDSRGQGVGEKLFLRVRDVLKNRNINSLKIVTGKDQIAAQKFYEKHEAILSGTQEIHKGSAYLIYKYNITE